jgi:hypothetical protein
MAHSDLNRSQRALLRRAPRSATVVEERAVKSQMNAWRSSSCSCPSWDRIITANADSDVGGIAYSQSGALFGYSMLWLPSQLPSH